MGRETEKIRNYIASAVETNTISQNEVLRVTPRTIIDVLKPKNPQALARKEEVNEWIRKALVEEGTLITIPNNINAELQENPSTLWIKKYMDESIEPLKEAISAMTEAIRRNSCTKTKC